MAMDSRRFDRTPKGHSEISQGNKSLKGKLRTVLFLIDAGKTADDIQRQILLIGAPADSIAQLVTAGYVAEVGKMGAPPADGAGPTDDRVANFRVAKAFMNETIVDALGIRAFGFTLRLERCATTDDLVALLPAYAEALLKKLDRDATRALVERTRELLAAARG
jgi:hypothetical protein